MKNFPSARPCAADRRSARLSPSQADLLVQIALGKKIFNGRSERAITRLRTLGLIEAEIDINYNIQRSRETRIWTVALTDQGRARLAAWSKGEGPARPVKQVCI